MTSRARRDRGAADRRPRAPTAAGGATRPLLLVISAPSGAGKTTLCDMLRAEFRQITYSVSCTTRPPRHGEVDGRDYHFLSPAEFERRRRRGEFLEHAVVHGYKYGTLKKNVLNALSGGRDVLMDIDVQGAAQVRKQAKGRGCDPRLRRAFVDIFITPPSLKELEKRLVTRALDSPEVIEQRLRNARREMTARREFQYRIVNDRLNDAYECLRAILKAERCRRR